MKNKNYAITYEEEISQGCSIKYVEHEKSILNFFLIKKLYVDQDGIPERMPEIIILHPREAEAIANFIKNPKKNIGIGRELK